MDAVKTYLIRILIAIDQIGTTIVGGFPDETLSSYAYRMDRQGKPWGRFWRPVIDWLFAWQRLPRGHCYESYLGTRSRVNMPPELR